MCIRDRFWEFSGGNVTENLVHQIAWIMTALDLTLPTAAFMSGGIFSERDGREVPDTIAVTLDFPNDLVVTWQSTFSNKHFGLGEHILGSDGTIEHGWGESDMVNGEEGEFIRYYPEKVNRPHRAALTGKTPDLDHMAKMCIRDSPYSLPWSNSNPTFTYRDNVTKSLGKHKLEFGGYFVNAEKNEYSFSDQGGDLTFDSTAPVSTGNAFADMLLGNIANFQQANAQPKYHTNYKMFEPYFQDDYHIFKNLTLNLGLRISLYGTFWERNHQVFNWDPLAYNRALAPQIDVTGNVTGQEGALILTRCV